MENLTHWISSTTETGMSRRNNYTKMVLRTGMGTAGVEGRELRPGAGAVSAGRQELRATCSAVGCLGTGRGVKPFLSPFHNLRSPLCYS